MGLARHYNLPKTVQNTELWTWWDHHFCSPMAKQFLPFHTKFLSCCFLYVHQLICFCYFEIFYFTVFLGYFSCFVCFSSKFTCTPYYLLLYPYASVFFSFFSSRFLHNLFLFNFSSLHGFLLLLLLIWKQCFEPPLSICSSICYYPNWVIFHRIFPQLYLSSPPS